MESARALMSLLTELDAAIPTKMRPKVSRELDLEPDPDLYANLRAYFAYSERYDGSNFVPNWYQKLDRATGLSVEQGLIRGGQNEKIDQI